MNGTEYQIYKEFIKDNIVQLCKDMEYVRGTLRENPETLSKCIELGDNGDVITKMSIHRIAGEMVASGELVLNNVATNPIKGN